MIYLINHIDTLNRGKRMGMKPIHRIPQLDSEGTLAQTVSGELKTMPPRPDFSITSELIAGIHYNGDNEEHLECWLDWAMQIRSELGIDWGTALKIASILYYG